MQEVRMANLMISIVTLATCSIALIAAFSFTPVVAAGGGGDGDGDGGAIYGGMDQRSAYPPSYYPKRSGSKATHVAEAKKANQFLFGDPAFAKGYREAYATVNDRNEHAAAIERPRALGHDDHPNVASLIGYSYWKLGDYKLSQGWYELALKADPNRVLTWNYYGLWQIEQGNREQAEYHLSRIAAILRNRLHGI
jgi:tetratricopeptide (TPR) repeat protein